MLLGLPDGLGLEATLFVVAVVAEQQALLALGFATALETVFGQAGAVEVDGDQRAAVGVAVVEAAAVGQSAVDQPANAVVAIAQGGPALVFGDQAVLMVIFISQRPMAVVDADQASKGVVAVIDRLAIWQGFSHQAASPVTLVVSDALTAIGAKLGLFQQVTVEVVGITGALAVETGFLSDQSVGRVVQLIVFAGFVFDFRQQQPRRVVAIFEFASVGVEPTADQVQIVGVFVAGGAAQFVPFGDDLAVGVVAPSAGGATGQGGLQQTAHGVPLVMGDGAVFVLAGQQTPLGVVGKTPLAAIRQGFFRQLAQAVAHKIMGAGVRVADGFQLPLDVVVVPGALAVRVDGLDDVALVIAAVGPHGFAALPSMQETVAVLVGRGLVFRRNQRHQPSDFVVAVFSDGAERVLLGDQPALFVIGLEVFAAGGIDLAHQSRAVVVDVDFLAAIEVVNGDAAVLAPGVAAVHLRERRPVPHAARRRTGALPLPVKTRAAGQLPLEDDVLVVVVVALAFASRIGRFDESETAVVAVGNQRLFSAPTFVAGRRRVKTLVVDGDQVAMFVAQAQAASGAVVQPADVAVDVALDGQAVVVPIAQGDQTTVAKM